MHDKPVAVKGMGDGFKLILSPDLDETDLLQEIESALTPIKHLMKGAHIYIDYTGENELDLNNKILAYLKDNFSVESVTPFQNQEKIKTEQKVRYRTRETQNGFKGARSDVLMISGRVRSGQKIDTEKHLIIYGDVNPGAEVIAGGDIIVLGTLSGTAIAGQKQDNSSIIFSLNFKPMQIQINDIVGVGGTKKEKKEPEIAYLTQSKELIVKKYMDENPFSRLPWPEIR